MIDKIHFKENKSRKRVPYKECVTDTVELSRFVLTHDEREIVIEAVLPQKPHEHWTYNLKNRAKELLLPNNVRKIVWNEAGYYIVYDDNEDYLIEQYGIIPLDKFRQAYWIVDKHGKLLCDYHFQDARPYPGSTILVKDSNKYNLLNLKGDFILCHFVEHILGYFGGKFYFLNEGILYSYSNGKTEKNRELKIFNDTGKYYCSGSRIINGKTLSGIQANKHVLFSNDYHLILECDERGVVPVNSRRGNILINGQYLLFDNWYDIRKVRLGLYNVKKGDKQIIISANEDIILDHSTLIVSDETFVISKNNRGLFVYDYDGKLINQPFSSCMWCNRGGIWNICVSDVNNQQEYLFGNASEVLEYAQSIITQNNLLALLERDYIWYAIDKNGKLHECFRNYKHLF